MYGSLLFTSDSILLEMSAIKKKKNGQDVRACCAVISAVPESEESETKLLAVHFSALYKTQW